MSAHSPTPSAPGEDPKRPHVYDGIEEFDKRLPNWWLFTLYGAIVFWIIFWAATIQSHVLPTNEERVSTEMARIEAARLADVKTLDDASLWKMSQNPVVVEAGKAVFTANCVPCHLASLKGKHENPTAIGPDLTDDEWLHGGKPMDIYNTITHGVQDKGMPTWGPILGPKHVSEAAAYVLSHHTPPADTK